MPCWERASAERKETGTRERGNAGRDPLFRLYGQAEFLRLVAGLHRRMRKDHERQQEDGENREFARGSYAGSPEVTHPAISLGFSRGPGGGFHVGLRPFH